MEDDPLFRRTRQHAEKRLVFYGAKSDKQWLKDIKEFLNLKNFELLKTSNKDWKNNNEWIQADFLFIIKEKSIR